MSKINPIGAKVQREGTPTEKMLIREELQNAVRTEVEEFHATRYEDRSALLQKKILEMQKLPRSEFPARLQVFRLVVTKAGLLQELSEAYQTISTAALRKSRETR